MSQKIMLPSRLSPELVDEINAQAASHGCDVDSLLSLSLDALKRIERGDEQLSDRVDQMQTTLDKKFAEFTGAVSSLVGSLSQMIPILIAAEDQAFRANSNARLAVAFGDLFTSKADLPSKKDWDEHKLKIATQAKTERETALAARSNK